MLETLLWRSAKKEQELNNLQATVRRTKQTEPTAEPLEGPI